MKPSATGFQRSDKPELMRAECAAFEQRARKELQRAGLVLIARNDITRY
ncbi:hypothetical protein [Dyella subtropica]|nr:hypothetical protein [Dyella subtropica]